jgi:hypothetical protein
MCTKKERMKHTVVAIDGGIVNVGVCVLTNDGEGAVCTTYKECIAEREPRTTAEVCAKTGAWVAANVDKLKMLRPGAHVVIESVKRPKIQAVGISIAAVLASLAASRGLAPPNIRFMHGASKFAVTPECRAAVHALKGKKAYEQRKMLAEATAKTLCVNQQWCMPGSRDECDAVLLAVKEWKDSFRGDLPK